MTDETIDPLPELPTGDYFASCERCGWSATGERTAVIRAGMAHECQPDQPASDGQPSVDSPAPAERTDG